MVNPDCPFMEFYDASCNAGYSCGNDALDLALSTCEYYSNYYGKFLVMEAFNCTEPEPNTIPFEFSFACVNFVYPCIED